MKNNLLDLLASLPEPVTAHIQHLERMRQDFVANVSHELRTPLTVMHGYLEALLESKTTTPEYEKIFTQMQQQTLRMESLVDGLLFLSKLEHPQINQNDSKQVVVPKLLAAILLEAQQLSAKHKINLQADNNLMLIGSETELRSLFSNIIFNAIKYTPANGDINIEWYTNKSQACFRVTDTGIGIAAEHLPRLTERFYRVDPARSRNSGGTGLGLAIVKHVLIRHQAKLTITSEPNKGSVFTCVFPKKRTVTALSRL